MYFPVVARLQHPRMPSSLAKNKFWPNPEGYRHTLPIEILGVEPAIVNCAIGLVISSGTSTRI
jgi:hypothetical protein